MKIAGHMKQTIIFSVTVIFLLSILFSCENNKSLPDGDFDEEFEASELENDSDLNESYHETQFICSGNCTIIDKSVCIGENVCACENGTWRMYDCDDVCATDGGQFSKGCAPNSQMGGAEYCLCSMEQTDGDEDYEPEPVCSGPCDESFELECTDMMTLCTCNQTTMEQEEVDCNDICEDAGYCGSPGCETNPNSGMDICNCYGCPQCTSDQDCIAEGKEVCVTMGDNSSCADACDMNTCSDTVGCMDVGQGSGCGICFDMENADKCNADCPACEGDKVCTDVCGLYPDEPLCVETCEAAPNTCNAEETCLPLAIDSEGTIGERGACIAFIDLNCDTCGERGIDGDMENDVDSFLDGDFECQIDGDEEIEYEIEYDIEESELSELGQETESAIK